MKYLSVTAITLMMSLLTTQNISADHHAQKGMDVEKSLAQLNADFDVVKARGFAWTTTGPLIQQAKEALANGKHKEAAELISKAALQVKASMAQSEATVENLLEKP